MFAASCLTPTRRAALALAALQPLASACRDRASDAPPPVKQPATADPVDAANRKAPYKKPGPPDAQNPLGVPPAPDITKGPTGKTETVLKYYPNGNGYVEEQHKQLDDGTWIRHGRITAWHENGVIQQDGEYTDAKISGHWRYWDDLGQLEREGDYDEGLREGDWKEFHPGNKPKSAGFFHIGLAEGPWKFWHDNGQLESEGEFVNNLKEGVWKFYLPNGDVDVDHTGTYEKNHKVK
jgi:antitoxin component YwqK of YwqJK toxin-antitoxin module